MQKTQLPRMQHLSRRAVTRELLQSQILAVAVDEVTNQRVAKKLEMNPNLVGTPGMKISFDEGSTFQSIYHPVTGMGLSSALFIHRHAFAVRRVPGNRNPYIAAVARDRAAHN